VLRGTAQNPDVFFQAREAVQPYYDACPASSRRPWTVRRADRPRTTCSTTSARPTPSGHRADGLGAETARRPSSYLTAAGREGRRAQGAAVPAVLRRALLAALPKTVKSIAVLDRTKEPGAPGEPLYQDVVTALARRSRRRRGALADAAMPRSSAAATACPPRSSRPAMVKAVFDELAPRPEPKNHFTSASTTT
jgi:pyruvate-ferredoxin/flavodoxin oxidoreductase